MAFSISSSSGYRYDVFLSFRGTDTRNNFMSHLHNMLCRQGIDTFMDDEELRRGEDISSSLLKAIEESRVSIIVFSKNYGFSGWCLDELVKILECRSSKKQMVLPIFYHVKPSHIRKVKGSLKDAFVEYEEKLKVSADKLLKWRSALKEAASLSGYYIGDRQEAECINMVVEDVQRKLNRTPLNVASHPVGIPSRVEDVNMLIDYGSETEEVRVVGINGMGGIGKTTIAKEVYNSHNRSQQFDGCSFLANVRDISSKQYGLETLQEKLLVDMLGYKNLKVENVDRGINMIRQRLCNKRVLVVIDDVDHLDQLRNLAGERNWFGSGSVIIITTRDEHLLVAHGVQRIYKNRLLPHSDALQLFSFNAFNQFYPVKEYEDLSHNVVKYASGLPLALIVLGSFLCGRSIPEWKSTLEKLKRIPDRQIYEMLKISYDGLEDHQKAIFLDIACFFNGELRDRIRDSCESCSLYPDIGLAVLSSKCLITIESNRVKMHDLLQEMGREIVRRECPEEPGKRSRLCFHEDICLVLENNTGTNAVEGIMLDLPKPERVNLSANAFKKMSRLRLLIVRNAYLSGSIDYLSNELRWIEWDKYPLSSLPSSFHPTKICLLRMCHSHLRQLGNIIQNFRNLKAIDLSFSKFLTEIPDLSSAPSLENLTLYQCTALVELDNSIGYHDKLLFLDLGSCCNLRTLPRNLKMKSLQALLLTGCSKLEKFPNIEGEMTSLKEIHLGDTAIKELPYSVEYLTSLEVLVLEHCQSLTDLPCSIYKLIHLRSLNLEGCSKLQKLPQLIAPTDRFLTLVSLHLPDCNLSGLDFLMASDCFQALETLSLSGNNFVTLPACINRLARLWCLELQNCLRLTEIPELPPNLVEINARGCWSLKSYSTLSTMLMHSVSSPTCKVIDFSECYNLVQNQGSYLETIFLCKEVHEKSQMEIMYPGSHVPKWFSHESEKSSIWLCPKPEAERITVTAICLCIVVGSEVGGSSDISCQVRVTVDGLCYVNRYRPCPKSNSVWMWYLPQHSQWSRLGWSQPPFMVSFEIIGRGAVLNKCGAHLLYKHAHPQNVWSLLRQEHTTSSNVATAYNSLPAKRKYDHISSSNLNAFERLMDK